MNDDCMTLRSDVQQCIASNVNLDSTYNNFLFNSANMELARTFGCFENLEIFPDGEMMRFKGEIAKDLHFSEEDMIKIKQQIWRKNATEIIKQAIENQKTEQQKQNERVIAQIKLKDWLNYVDEMQNAIKEKSKDKKERAEKILKGIQDVLKNIGIDLEYEETDTMIMLSETFNSLNLTKNQLRLLADIVQALDLFLIASNYDWEDEENENCNGIRIVLSINICEEG